jgi:hypothetical protein
MGNSLGITQDGLKAALDIKDNYKKKRPILVPGEDSRLLMPENLLNHNIDLSGIEDPLPLAMMATRDPEGPMALAAVARLCPLGRKTKLIAGVAEIVGETSKHELVKECLKFVNERAFEPESIVRVRRHASKVIVESRQQYTAALRENLHCLLEGSIAPRQFVREFFELTEAGNMRHDIRHKLVSSLLLSGNVRPSVKFMMLENLERMPKAVRLSIVSAVLKAEPTRHSEIIKEELRYIVTQQNLLRDVH